MFRLNDKFNDTVSAMTTGIETAKALFEDAHPGVKINLHRYSHGEDLESVVAAANQAILDKMPAVIGGELSEEAVVLRDTLGPKKIVFVTPTSSSPAVTENQPYAFRSCFSDRLVATRLANLTVDYLRPTAVGIIHNVSSPYTDFLSAQFLESFRKRAAESGRAVPIYEEKILRDTVDFTNQIRKFIEMKVTHVVAPIHQSDLLRFVLQARNKGFYPIYVGSDGWGSNEHVFAKLVKDSNHGQRFIGIRNSYWREGANTSMARRFRTRYVKMNKIQPNAWSAIAFDAAWVLFTGMNTAQDPKNGGDIRDRLRAIRGLELVTSEKFSFGADNSPLKDLYIYKIDKTGVHYEVTLK